MFVVVLLYVWGVGCCSGLLFDVVVDDKLVWCCLYVGGCVKFYGDVVISGVVWVGFCSVVGGVVVVECCIVDWFVGLFGVGWV